MRREGLEFCCNISAYDIIYLFTFLLRILSSHFTLYHFFLTLYLFHSVANLLILRYFVHFILLLFIYYFSIIITNSFSIFLIVRFYHFFISSISYIYLFIYFLLIIFFSSQELILVSGRTLSTEPSTSSQHSCSYHS